MTTYADRVARGIEILNDRDPDWREMIDAAILDMSDAWLCILGQRFGEYTQGLDELAPGPGIDHGAWAISHGFEDANGFYGELTATWKMALS